MIVKTLPVYYCEHCRRHRLTRSSIERHEPRCIYNPDRSECGWHEPNVRVVRPADHVAGLRESLDLDLLRELTGGCPACILAVVVQADLHVEDRHALGFVYADEVARYREAEHRGDAAW